jgi:simple sugar transport system permease protein
MTKTLATRSSVALLRLVPSLLALVLSLIAGAIVMAAVGNDPVQVYGRFFAETLGTPYGIGQVLFKATPLMLTGLSAAIAFRAGLFNIGAEGQLLIGAICTAILGCSFPELPSILLLPLCLLGGMAGGAIWGAVPGLLKARFGSHEVINTIMMNFIAAALVSYLVTNVYAVPATVHTPLIAPAAEIPRLDTILPALRGSPANLSILIALAACALTSYLIWKTRFGYELRAVGYNQHAASYGRIPIQRTIVLTMATAGAVAGLVGSNFVLGYKHYFELGFSEGIGFIGIAVALLAKNNPGGIIAASLFFGILEYGGLTVNTLVPKELINILQAVIIVLLIVLTRILQRRIDAFQARKELAAQNA